MHDPDDKGIHGALCWLHYLEFIEHDDLVARQNRRVERDNELRNLMKLQEMENGERAMRFIRVRGKAGRFTPTD